jgi:flagellum-specific peptidoglycan hydrolase FlgJ
MIDSKKLFDKIREIKGNPLTQAEVDSVNAILAPVMAAPDIPPHPKLSMDVLKAAQASERAWGVPAAVSLAQYAVESGWGAHMPPGSNNPFGIKALPGQPSVTVKTREVNSHGATYYIDAPFRKFASIAEAFDEHAKLLATKGAYTAARACLPNVDGFCDALTGVYATDPAYGRTLKSVMKSQGLYAYNLGAKA